MLIFVLIHQLKYLFCVFKRIVALSEAVLVKYGNLKNMIKYILIKKHLSLGPECFVFFFVVVFCCFLSRRLKLTTQTNACPKKK